MKENYAKTMLYAYPYIDTMVKRIGDKILKKAMGSMFDTSPCEDQCVSLIMLTGQKADLQYLKHLIERMMMKFSIEEFNYFDFKYFHVQPKSYYKDKLKLDRTYYRRQERLLKKFCSILSAIGGDDEWFEQKFLSIRYIKNLYLKIEEKEKTQKRSHS